LPAEDSLSLIITWSNAGRPRRPYGTHPPFAFNLGQPGWLSGANNGSGASELAFEQPMLDSNLPGAEIQVALSFITVIGQWSGFLGACDF